MSNMGIENLKIQETDIPEPNNNQILARVDACTICTSILKLLEQGSEHAFLNGWDISQFPIIPGDEGSITAVRVGKNLQGKYRIGEKLAIQPAIDHGPINHRERYRNPEMMKKTAVGYTLGGHLAEYILVQEEVIETNCLVKIPSQELGYYEISLSEPLSCAFSSQDHHIHLVADSITGERVAKKGLLEDGITVIFGAGVMGRLQIEVALTYKPKKIIVFDIEPEKFKWIETFVFKKAKEKGVSVICQQTDGNVNDILYKITGRNYADDIIDATGNRKAQEAALKLAGKGSVFNSFGGLKLADSIIGVDMRKVHYDEMIITGSSGGNWSDTKKVLEFIYNKEINVDNHISIVGDLSQSIEFLSLVKSGKINGKAIVYPHTGLDKPLMPDNGWTKEKEKTLLLHKSIFT